MISFSYLVHQILKSISHNITKDILIGAYFAYFYHPQYDAPGFLHRITVNPQNLVTHVIIDIEKNFWVCNCEYGKGEFPAAHSFVLNQEEKNKFSNPLNTDLRKMTDEFLEHGHVEHLRYFRLIKNTQMGNDKLNLLQIKPPLDL